MESVSIVSTFMVAILSNATMVCNGVVDLRNAVEAHLFLIHISHLFSTKNPNIHLQGGIMSCSGSVESEGVSRRVHTYKYITPWGVVAQWYFRCLAFRGSQVRIPL